MDSSEKKPSDVREPAPVVGRKIRFDAPHPVAVKPPHFLARPDRGGSR
jgi:hypothetical protein